MSRPIWFVRMICAASSAAVLLSITRPACFLPSSDSKAFSCSGSLTTVLLTDLPATATRFFWASASGDRTSLALCSTPGVNLLVIGSTEPVCTPTPGTPKCWNFGSSLSASTAFPAAQCLTASRSPPRRWTSAISSLMSTPVRCPKDCRICRALPGFANT